MSEPRPPDTHSDTLAMMHLLHTGWLHMEERLVAHMASEPATVAAAVAAEVATILTTAFPEGDPAGHRKHHEAVIAAAEENAEFWKKMRVEIGKYGILSLLGWAVLALWQVFSSF